MEKLHTVEQAAHVLSLNKQTVQRFIREGKIKAFKAGREYRIAEKELEAYLTRQYA